MDHTAGKRAVAEDGDRKVIPSGNAVRLGVAERGGDRGGGVSGAESVVRTLAHGFKAGESPGLSQGVKAVHAAAEDLMDVGLVSDVKDQAVAREIKDAVGGDGHFDNAEVGGEMSAARGHLFDQKSPDLPAKRGHIRLGQRGERGAETQFVEQGKGGAVRGAVSGHDLFFCHGRRSFLSKSTQIGSELSVDLHRT